jgi:hypothetical protein
VEESTPRGIKKFIGAGTVADAQQAPRVAEANADNIATSSDLERNSDEETGPNEDDPDEQMDVVGSFQPLS